MKGLQYQLKNILRDKMCMLTFLLPVIAGFAVNMLADVNFSSIGGTEFGIVQDNLTSEAESWLAANGSVTAYEDTEQLLDAVNEPATQMIGIVRNGESFRTVISGDELQLYKQIANVLPELYSRRSEMNTVEIEIHPAAGSNEWLKSLLIAITMVTAMFMGCTYNAMNLIGEKEDGISMINEVLPMTKKQFLLQKVTLGLTGGILSAVLTAIICIRIPVRYVMPLLLFIVLSAVISSLTGLFIGRIAGSLMTGIAFIKLIMILFIAPPILCYLVFPADGMIRTISFLLPSSVTFYGLMELTAGQAEHLSLYLLVLLMHSIILLLLYVRIDSRYIKVMHNKKGLSGNNRF